jgi:hypothetical protein
MSQSKEPSARWLNKPRIVRPEPKIKESKELEVKFINPKHKAAKIIKQIMMKVSLKDQNLKLLFETYLNMDFYN